MAIAIDQRIANELSVAPTSVKAAVTLLDEGSTVPFIARYRKEATGGLTDEQLRTLEERLAYLRDLEDRRKTILESVSEQGKLTDELAAQIQDADTKARLEDLYLPYKPKRRTKAQIAREAGLEPLADALWHDPTLDPEQTAAGYVNPEVDINDLTSALNGARAILTERFSEDADVIGQLRERMWSRGRLVSTVRDGKEADGKKFSDYFDFAQGFDKLPSHRVLAMLRGEKEEVLSLTLEPGETEEDVAAYEAIIASHFGIHDQGRAADKWLAKCVSWAWKTRIIVKLGVDVRMRLWNKAEDEAVAVFAGNLRDLLLAAPAGQHVVMGLDPAYRTGVKVAVVDATGKVVDTAAVFPHQPQNQWDKALATLATLAQKHDVDLIAIGNGTASRETDKLAAELVKALPAAKLKKIMISEAGASVYSASAYASRELPSLDVSLRGAVSIARRLQDPLAELVKIDPKHIGVGQYQHDLTDAKLTRSLDAVVEDCVNAVGVDLNTASVPLLARVSGISESIAGNIVAWRDENGKFPDRKTLLKVPRLGPKAFEQAAGFLRVPQGTNPLDTSAVHPEAYPVVERILAATGGGIETVIGNSAKLQSLKPADFADETFGVPTVSDILLELDKPGRDPRPEFTTASFADGVEKMSDLKPGMILEGVVTNVAAFGAFVDVGVHQDGLVHISAMANTFISDPRQVAKPGDVVKVKVQSVELERKRISLTMRLDEPEPDQRPAGKPQQRSREGQPQRRQGRGNPNDGRQRGSSSGGAMAEALRRAGLTD
ncbi:RNA-binding transcriptional accessory protein [Natronoglycomyces albus]|uniref:RNA-binding transcriptional accessory protein n=1 Tax=Natronoglycomyces albus TaxID=2811108 RepID=A0A895XE54_9ACTN|nr:Tex family protein [Natronoglycomyces albus]QSB04101.1 RNA-binding transcriptional accessory protein [Natronoglycomyces albus]